MTTSARAYELARLLCDDRAVRVRKDKELNLRKEKQPQAAGAGTDDRRTVTEINYEKHEQTVKELDRQEKEEKFEKAKQEASQWCTLDHEHGPWCRRPTGGCSHDHQKEWQIYEKSTQEKIDAADRFRQEGNEAYKRHNYGLAAVHYRKALLQFDYTFPEGEEEEKACERVKVPCLLNLAACKCQQEEWDEVLMNCRLALEVDPRLVKAYYRQGLAYTARDEFDLAKEALMSAHEIEPKNAEVLGALRQLRDNKEKYKARRKEVAREMISGAAEEDAKAPEAAAEACEEERPPTAEPPPPPEPHAESSLRQRRRGPSGAEPPGAEPPPAAGAEGAAGEGEDEQDDDDAEEAALSASQGRALNGILALAACLGAVAIVALLSSAVSD